MAVVPEGGGPVCSKRELKRGSVQLPGGSVQLPGGSVHRVEGAGSRVPQLHGGSWRCSSQR